MTQSVSNRLRSRPGLTLTRNAPSRQTRILSSGPGRQDWGIAEETPVEIGFNGRAWTVMMATPSDLEDLAVGLALTEGVIADPAAIQDITARTWPEGITVDIAIDDTALDRDRIQRRTLDGRTGCGLCGVESLADIHRPTARARGPEPVDDAAIATAFQSLPDHQALNAETRSVHAAAWCDLAGEIRAVREDVGRHNALDKLVGAVLRDAGPDASGFVILSSRCSFELVFKAARLGAACLASVSAPTGLALDLARELDLPIVSQGPGGVIVRFEQGDGA